MAIVNEEQVIRVLRQYNPWWRSPSAIREESKPHKRVAFYEALKIIRHETIRRFALLSGARRVGKTTILYQVIECLLDEGVNPKNILYASFDNPVIRQVPVEGVLSTYESLYPVEGTRYLFFDEIQYTDSWEMWMKVIYDERPDIRMAATGSASPILEKGSAESGTGRWAVLKIPTMSFYEYCQLLGIEGPELPDGLGLGDLSGMTYAALGDVMSRFSRLEGHFNRYLSIGGFPEFALAKDDAYARRMLREDVVDKVIKRDVLTLFSVRSPLLMERLFLYLCMNSSEIFSAATVAKELGISVGTVESYIEALEMSNLIYLSRPIGVGSKGALKGRPKVYVADPAIRSAVLMEDDFVSDEELGVAVELEVYKHVVSFFQGRAAQVGYYRRAKDNQKEVDVVVGLPRGKMLVEVKYRADSRILASDAIVDLCRDEGAGVTGAFLVTKRLDDFGPSRHETRVPIMRVPAIAFLYILGRTGHDD